MPLPTTGSGGIMFPGRLFVCPLTAVSHDMISLHLVVGYQ